LTTIIDGKEVSKKIKEDVRKQVEKFTKETGVQPGLATILVGENSASQVYVKNKRKSTEACGMKSFHHQLDENISQEDLLSLIDQLNKNKDVHGILVQLPLPKQIDSSTVIHAIDPKKDVDGFHPENIGLLTLGIDSLQPCTPLGIMELLKHYDISVSGKDVLIIGRSNIVGKPLALMMLHAHATVCIAHSKTQDLHAKVRNADVVVAAIGRANFVKGEWLDQGTVVIDVGINRKEDGKLCGDVDFEPAKERTSYITPVPGGVGPMTIAMLMSNTLKAAKGIVGM